MTREELLKEYILRNYKSLRNFVATSGIDVPYSTLDGIFKRGIGNASLENIFKICDVLGISADGLIEGKIIPKEDYGKKDMEVMQAFESLIHQYILVVDKKPISKEEYWMLFNSLFVSVQLIKQRRDITQDSFASDLLITDPNQYLRNLKTHSESKESDK